MPLVQPNRDSTAISDQDSQFFVLQKEAINKMSNTFYAEFKEVENLAIFRRRRHTMLIR